MSLRFFESLSFLTIILVLTGCSLTETNIEQSIEQTLAYQTPSIHYIVETKEITVISNVPVTVEVTQLVSSTEKVTRIVTSTPVPTITSTPIPTPTPLDEQTSVFYSEYYGIALNYRIDEWQPFEDEDGRKGLNNVSYLGCQLLEQGPTEIPRSFESRGDIGLGENSFHIFSSEGYNTLWYLAINYRNKIPAGLPVFILKGGNQINILACTLGAQDVLHTMYLNPDP